MKISAFGKITFSLYSCVHLQMKMGQVQQPASQQQEQLQQQLPQVKLLNVGLKFHSFYGVLSVGEIVLHDVLGS